MSDDRSTIGSLYQTREKLTVEWKIADFSVLPKELDVCYSSPIFAFSESLWRLQIYPNGRGDQKESEGYIGLYLTREEGRDEYYYFDLTIKMQGVAKLNCTSDEGGWFDKNTQCGNPKVIKRSELKMWKSKYRQSDVLTVGCCLRMIDDEGELVRVPLLERLLNVSGSLKGTLDGGKWTDVILKVDGQEIRANKAILEARSNVFAAMLSHDMIENRTGVVAIEDTPADVFRQVLSYMYSGRVDELTDEKVCQIYVEADKYDLGDLKKLCATHMQQSVSVGLFCDVLAIANTYGEKELERTALHYFSRNSMRILESDEWKKFASENNALALKLLEKAWKGMKI